MNFFSNIFAAFIIIASATATDTIDETNTISFEETESSLRGGGNIHRRFRKLAEGGRQLDARQLGPSNNADDHVYRTCSRCPSNEHELCAIYITSHGKEVFMGCRCESGYTSVFPDPQAYDWYCAGANGMSCTDDVYCVSGYCENGICDNPPTYSVVGETAKCGLANDGKRLAWNAGTTAACADMVAADSECTDIFMVKNKNQALGGSDNLEYGTTCVCVTNGQSCSMNDAPHWNTFSLN